MENLKEFNFSLNEKENRIKIEIENNKICIKCTEKGKDLPFEYNMSYTLVEFKEKINILDNLEEIKIFLENILAKKENIKAEIDEEENNITLTISYNITRLKKNLKLNLTKLFYLIKQRMNI